ncbi:MAG: TIGR02453 family protein [Deltaproteobacteria bacterium]|nr:TIGR02453 family protein [Deltaproteobacteria bacterium]
MAAHFSPRLFRFLRELAVNNDRAWFHENKERFDRDVKLPLMGFISDFAPRLKKISAHFVADPDPRHGSMFRIHRDTRFSKDKSPYKTHASAHFRHGIGKDVHGPGFYLHLEPKSVFIGVGIWHPAAPTLLKLRTHLVEAPGEWAKALKHKPFQGYALRGESLKRPPKGFDKDHPLVTDLCRKDFIAVLKFRETDATSAEFLSQYAERAKAAVPFMRFLSNALELPF